jgi:DNA-binding transcriptional regulator YiaG
MTLIAKSSVSAQQIRAARGLLGISAAELANQAGVNWKTVQRFESAEKIPESRSGTLARVMAALEAAGIHFIGDPLTSPGVQLRTLDAADTKDKPEA